MAQRKIAGRRSPKRARHDSTYETYDQVVAGVLLMDGLPLLSAERRGDGVAFIFRSRPGLAAQVLEIERIGEECEAARRQVEALMAAATAVDQRLTEQTPGGQRME
jgi:hypothetical protein